VESRLKGRVALVTGAGQGIGQAIALRLAAEGADVAVVDINAATVEETARLIRAAGGRTLAAALDLSAVAGIPALVARVEREIGPLGILVNNAGVVVTRPLLDITESDWDRVIDINQKGLFFCMQAVAASMLGRVPEAVRASGESEQCYGKIVNLSSISGRHGRALQAPYAASKAAIISLTQSAALAFAPFLNVNAIAPSIVATPMWEQVDRDRSRLAGQPAGHAMKNYTERIPLKRPGTVQDMAAAVAFLCSPDADYITGQCLNVDGGFEMN
jgi:meso-butanediol dehydrogenase / (S,S)-butanediol dehydrogenase / diacetyl reductase